MRMGGHDLERGSGVDRRLRSAFFILIGFAGVEAFVGWRANSLALLGDAGHMVTDAAALGLAWLAQKVSRLAGGRRHSFGLQRLEVLAALVNALVMLAVVALIAWHAVRRLQAPVEVAGLEVTAVAAVGLGVNIWLAWMLHHGPQSLNLRGALLHVLGDLLGSVAALSAGLVIWTTGWMAIDPLLSLLIGMLILLSTLRLLRDALNVLLEGVPSHLDLDEITTAMAATAGVQGVHDAHVWTLSSEAYALSAHVEVADLSFWEDTRHRLDSMLGERFGIAHVTLQPEPVESACAAIDCGETSRGAAR